MDDFVAWLNAEMEKQGWSLRQTARRTGVSHTTMTNIVNRQTRPSADFCRRIALVFHAPPEEVLCRAGILPTGSKETPSLREATYLFNLLSPEQQDVVLTFVRSLVGDQGRTRLWEATPAPFSHR